MYDLKKMIICNNKERRSLVTCTYSYSSSHSFFFFSFYWLRFNAKCKSGRDFPMEQIDSVKFGKVQFSVRDCFFWDKTVGCIKPTHRKNQKTKTTRFSAATRWQLNLRAVIFYTGAEWLAGRKHTPSELNTHQGSIDVPISLEHTSLLSVCFPLSFWRKVTVRFK